MDGGNDPRMPTISGMRRRGYPAEAIRLFCKKAGVAKRDNVIEYELLEACVREVLNKTTDRVMAVLNPVKLVSTNYPDGQTEMMTAVNNPEDENSATRELPFSKELWIERDDFKEDPPKKFFRLGPGRNVRLKNAYIINCTGFEKNDAGEVTEIHATYYPDSKSGEATSGVKAKGTLHWVRAPHALTAEVRNYERLFTDPTPTSHDDRDFLEFYNKESLEVLDTVYVEPNLKDYANGTSLQFMRKGYYAVDETSSSDSRVFNRTVTLRDTWAKQKKK